MRDKVKKCFVACLVLCMLLSVLPMTSVSAAASALDVITDGNGARYSAYLDITRSDG